MTFLHWLWIAFKMIALGLIVVVCFVPAMPMLVVLEPEMDGTDGSPFLLWPGLALATLTLPIWLPLGLLGLGIYGLYESVTQE